MIFNVIAGIIFSVLLFSPALVNTFGVANSAKRMRGWPETKARLVQTIMVGHEGQNFTAIAVDNRLTFFDLLYYGIEADTGLPLRMWLDTNHAVHHAEATAPLSATDGPVLLVNYFIDCAGETDAKYDECIGDIHDRGKLTYAEKFRADFKRLEELPTLKFDLGGGKIRTYRLWAGYGYIPTDKAER